MGYSVIVQVVAIPISSSIVLFYLNTQNPVFQLPPPPCVVLGTELCTFEASLLPELHPGFLPALSYFRSSLLRLEPKAGIPP